MKQFFTLFHEYKGNALFLTGESYAGKYLPALGYKIHQEKNDAKQHGINLQGFAIGDGFCDPENMLDYGHFLYQFGLVDEEQRDHFIEEQERAVAFIKNKQMVEAAMIFDVLLDSDFATKSYFTNVTGLTFYYNILYDTEPEAFNYYLKFLNQPKTRDSIHVGNLPYGNLSSKVELALVKDIMDSVKPWIEKLLNANYRMLFYSGQLDIIVAPPLTENFLRKLKWHGIQRYKKAPRIVYKVNSDDKQVAGYVRQVDNLYQAIIRNAGHILPFDQPRVALDLITRFVKNEKFN